MADRPGANASQLGDFARLKNIGAPPATAHVCRSAPTSTPSAPRARPRPRPARRMREVELQIRRPRTGGARDARRPARRARIASRPAPPRGHSGSTLALHAPRDQLLPLAALRRHASRRARSSGDSSDDETFEKRPRRRAAPRGRARHRRDRRHVRRGTPRAHRAWPAYRETPARSARAYTPTRTSGNSRAVHRRAPRTDDAHQRAQAYRQRIDERTASSEGSRLGASIRVRIWRVPMAAPAIAESRLMRVRFSRSAEIWSLNSVSSM